MNTRPRPDVNSFGVVSGADTPDHAESILVRAIFPAVLFFVGWLQPARAEEPHTFWGKTVEGWIAVFRDKASTEVQRRQAEWGLGCFGAEAKAVVPDLIDAIRKGQFPDGAIDALVQIGAGAEVTVPILIQRFLKRGCQHLTGMGAIGYDPSSEDSLVRIGGPAVPALLEILNGPNGDMRVCAARALARIGPPARAAVPSLIRAIEHLDPKREPEILVPHAIQALGRIGPEARVAIPVLNGLLDEDGDYDFDAVLALDQIGIHPSGNCGMISFARLIRKPPINSPGSARRPVRRFPPFVRP